MSPETLYGHPQARSFAAALEGGDEAAACACADWLAERGATLADVLRLYAGTRAGRHLDGLPAAGGRLVVSAWCRETDTSHDTIRWEAARSLYEDADLFTRTVYSDPDVQTLLGMPYVQLRGHSLKPLAGHPVVEEAGRKAKGVVARDLKRRVLGLFPEVRYREEVPVSEEALVLGDDPYLPLVHAARALGAPPYSPRTPYHELLPFWRWLLGALPPWPGRPATLYEAVSKAPRHAEEGAGTFGLYDDRQHRRVVLRRDFTAAELVPPEGYLR